MKSKDRMSQIDYYIELSKLIAKRSTCLSRQVGAVIVKDNTVLATGYNGSPKGCNHCLDIGCIRKKLNVPSGEKLDICRGAHAEQNAINFAAKNGTSIDNAELYCTTYPCAMCIKSIINSGIKKIYYVEGYSSPLTEILLNESGISIVQCTLQDH